MLDLSKPSRARRRLEQRRTRLDRKNKENTEKAKVRRRDRFCRFPLCGCRTLGLSLEARAEVSHQQHKGMGGNPTGDRSVAALMILLCLHRHQDGVVSRHKGTLRARYLTRDKANGPIAWDVDAAVIWGKLSHHEERRHNIRPQVWIEVARETAVQQLEPLRPDQRDILERLAEMDL